MQDTSLFYRFAVSLALGLLIGLQREYAADNPEKEMAAGLSVAQLSTTFESLQMIVAARAIVLAAAANTLSKGLIVMIMGAPRLKRKIMPGFMLMLFVGVSIVLVK